MCKVLRRMYLQNKLTSQEIELLSSINFKFSSLEDIYYEADFDDILARLVQYKSRNGDMQIPKKYNEDPELGAWCAGVRRLGPNNINVERKRKLDEIEFEWISTRKCGSSFMKHLRQLETFLEHQTLLELESKDEILWKWLQAQKLAIEKENLSQKRIQYLKSLLPSDWLCV